MPSPLPTPGPRIDDPLELLRACHDKVRRFAGLCVHLRDHLDHTPIDAQAQEAAQSILRYFELAAPLHHADEDVDLFPALRQLRLAALNTTIDGLEAEHHVLGGLWQRLQPWLREIAAGRASAAPAEVDVFAQRYAAHAQREEDEVYPHAQRLEPEQLRKISAAMIARRTSR